MEKKDLRSLSPSVLEELRRRVVYAVIEYGMKQKEASQVFGISSYSIRKWIYNFKTYGDKGLICQKRGKPKARGTLLPQQVIQTLSIIKEHSPDFAGLPFLLWTRSAIRAYILKEFNLNLSKWTISRFLKKCGIIPRYPLNEINPIATPTAYQWLVNDYPHIQERAKLESAQIYCCDTTTWPFDKINKNFLDNFLLDENAHVLLNASSKSYLIYAMNENETLYLKAFNKELLSKTLVDFFYRLIQTQKKKIFLIVKKNKFYDSEEVQMWLKDNKNKILVFYIPQEETVFLNEKTINSWNTLQVHHNKKSVLLNNFSLTSPYISSQIKDICSPLYHMGISSFSYLSINDPNEWIRAAPSNCRQDIEKTIQRLSLESPDQYFVWHTHPWNPVLYSDSYVFQVGYKGNTIVSG